MQGPLAAFERKDEVREAWKEIGKDVEVWRKEKALTPARKFHTIGDFVGGKNLLIITCYCQTACVEPNTVA